MAVPCPHAMAVLVVCKLSLPLSNDDNFTRTFLSPDSPQDIASPFPSQSLLSPSFFVCIMVQNCCKDNENNPFEQVSIVKSAEMCLFCLRLSRFEVNIEGTDSGYGCLFPKDKNRETEVSRGFRFFVSGWGKMKKNK